MGFLSIFGRNDYNNSNTRHHLARFTRRTKVVSRCKFMVDLSIRLWHYMFTGGLFSRLQALALAIF